MHSRLNPSSTFTTVFSEEVVEDRQLKMISSADLNILRTVAGLISSLPAIWFMRFSCVIIKMGSSCSQSLRNVRFPYIHKGKAIADGRLIFCLSVFGQWRWPVLIRFVKRKFSACAFGHASAHILFGRKGSVWCGYP